MLIISVTFENFNTHSPSAFLEALNFRVKETFKIFLDLLIPQMKAGETKPKRDSQSHSAS